MRILDREDVAGDAALHVARAAPVDAAVLDRGRPGIVAPALAVADRDHVGMAVEQQRAAAARALPGGDDVGAAFIATVDRAIAGMLLELFPVGLPHVDVEADVGQVFGQIGLDRRFVAGDARDRDHLLQEVDRLVAVLVDQREHVLPGFIAHGRSPNPIVGIFFEIAADAGRLRRRLPGSAAGRRARCPRESKSRYPATLR